MLIKFSNFFSGRPLSWLICKLHTVEILFRDIFVVIDGKSSGPDSYSGVIGQIITNKDNSWKTTNKVIRFKEKRNGLVKEPTYKLNNHDDNVIIQLCLLIQNGPDSKYKDAVKLTPGLINLARWKNTDACVLYLFVITDNPSDELIKLVDFSINVYVPAIQGIHENPHFTDGPRNFFNIIRLCRDHFKDEEKLYLVKPATKDKPDVFMTLYEVAKDVLVRNWYWGSYEHILMARMVDTDKEVRKVAIKEYEENEIRNNARLKRNPNAQPRKLQFVKEAFNYDNAQNYIEVFDVSKITRKPRLKTNFPLCSLFTIGNKSKTIFTQNIL